MLIERKLTKTKKMKKNRKKNEENKKLIYGYLDKNQLFSIILYQSKKVANEI